MFHEQIKQLRSNVFEIDNQIKQLEAIRQKNITGIYDFVHETVSFEVLRDEFLKIVDSGEYQLKNKQVRKINMTRDDFEIRKSLNLQYKMIITLTPPKDNFQGAALKEYEMIFRYLSFILFGDRDLILYDFKETNYNLKSIKLF